METLGVNTPRTLLAGAILLAVLAGAGRGWGITTAELADLLEADAPPILIDVRDPADYAAGHLPGAISIPARLCALKRLPPLGRVIVYGDGLRPDLTRAAVERLNDKPGITADMLAGGIGRWQARGLPVTGARGLKARPLPVITYDQLTAALAANPDIVLVDLRSAPSEGRSADGSSGPAPLTDLATAFPGARIVTDPFAAPVQRSAASGRSAPADPATPLVLIDNGAGDDRAQRTLRRVRAAGMGHCRILLGGDEMVHRRGQSGRTRLTR